MRQRCEYLALPCCDGAVVGHDASLRLGDIIHGLACGALSPRRLANGFVSGNEIMKAALRV